MNWKPHDRLEVNEAKHYSSDMLVSQLGRRLDAAFTPFTLRTASSLPGPLLGLFIYVRNISLIQRHKDRGNPVAEVGEAE